jgi:alkyldihydroxyacetonephosphate synthase
MLPHFTAWVVRRLGGDFSTKISSIPEPKEFPTTIEASPDFLSTLSSNSITYSISGPDRLFRSHGHTLHDIFSVRNGEFGRLPDLVVWPEHHEHVELIVKLAIDYNYVLIPFGGGTSVSAALRVPEDERRLVISLDTSQMVRQNFVLNSKN